MKQTIPFFAMFLMVVDNGYLVADEAGEPMVIKHAQYHECFSCGGDLLLFDLIVK